MLQIMLFSKLCFLAYLWFVSDLLTFSLFLYVFKTVVTCFYSSFRDVDFLVGINADPTVRFNLCDDSFFVGVFMSNYYLCTKITFEMAVQSSYLSPIRKANCVGEA